MKHFLATLLSLLIFFSCKTEGNEVEEYKIFTMKSGPKSSRTIDSMKFRTFRERDREVYEYKTLENDSTYYFLFEKNTDSNIFLKDFDVEFKLIDEIDFLFNNKKTTIYKYAYDLEDIVDEESDYYFSNEYGLIMIQSLAWLKTNILINEEEFKPLQDSIIENHYKFKSSYNLITGTTTEN